MVVTVVLLRLALNQMARVIGHSIARVLIVAIHHSVQQPHPMGEHVSPEKHWTSHNCASHCEYFPCTNMERVSLLFFCSYFRSFSYLGAYKDLREQKGACTRGVCHGYAYKPTGCATTYIRTVS